MRKSLLSAILLAPALALAAGSAIITLEMPVGARQLGMGEAGAALADDAAAMYYNPAGLAFGPLADEWRMSYPADSKNAPYFTSMASRSKNGFFSKSELWAGTANGILKFDGEQWVDYHSITLQGNAKVRDAVKVYAGSERGLEENVRKVKEFNEIKTADDEKHIVEVKMPWNLIVKDTITAVLYESRTEKLWVGTPKSLYRFDGKAWKSYDSELGNHRVTALVSQGASIWIGTDDGLFVYRNGQFEQKGKVLPSQKITALVWSELRKELYVAAEGAGVARLIPKKSVNDKDRWSLFNEEDGVMDKSPTALAVDSSGHVWAAHKGGLSHFNLRKWEQIQFADNTVNDISVDQKGGIWIATDKGVWRHLPDYATASGRKAELERTEADEAEGKRDDEWVHYHSGNGLSVNKVWAVLPQGNDVWFSTANGMEQFKDADYQLTAFYEKLLPILNIPDLYHLYGGMTIPLNDWGTMGFFVNFVSFGSTVASGDVDADDLVAYNSSEIVGGFSYGTRFPGDWGLGLSIKFFYSDLSSGAGSGSEEATTFGYAFDVGVLKKNLIVDGLNFALVLANIGPSVYYVDKTIEDPIPLTWRLGLSYEILSLADYKWVVVADYNREVVYDDSKGNPEPFYVSCWKSLINPERGGSGLEGAKNSLMQGVFNVGTEFIYANTIALRLGYLHDQTGKRDEVDMGFGFMLSDMLQFDFATIKDVGESDGVRDGQMRFGMVFKF
ncbi:Two component regulator propeller [Fibrobacter sp. UWH9]|uniref:PorV/PorQ family protein n=1 Tax=unclassified Fibrobacter TaxID=2634177 RepID=UPI000919A3FB|nr:MULTISPECIES: PorV/PorQ family protein [unclassified Fibrobacter]MDO4948131.1 PorV/PorQ family protein [Fibrobacter sp.]OWV05956.1 regulator [Fibrobacter sp. UWH3]OWV08355.1 regulator [Fibrobacter sp. UWH1]SHH13029.1 Two component regulator propeller [Fibrobacter sp. UWH9]SHK96973.1 Two component regulator propeller [Fibrobacter sp. UWH5]